MMQLLLPFKHSPKTKLNDKDYQEAALRIFEDYPDHKRFTMEGMCALVARKLRIEPQDYVQAFAEIKKTILSSTFFTYTRGREGGVSLGRQHVPCSAFYEACA